eukprot:144934-Rhodomonas_salina.2
MNFYPRALLAVVVVARLKQRRGSVPACTEDSEDPTGVILRAGTFRRPAVQTRRFKRGGSNAAVQTRRFKAAQGWCTTKPWNRCEEFRLPKSRFKRKRRAVRELEPLELS